METLTIRDRIYMAADKGKTEIRLNLYNRQLKSLMNDGYSIQRIGPVHGYSNQFSYKISWKEASKKTLAYAMLQKAAEMNPELLPNEDSDDSAGPVPPPYSGGGWNDSI